MKTKTPRNFGLFVTGTTPVKTGTLLTTPFTLADGSVVTILSRTRKGKSELTDWGMTADYLKRFNRKWDDVLERMALRHVAHGRVTIEGKEIISRVDDGDIRRNIGAIVQTILTMSNIVLLSHDPSEEAFARKVDDVVHHQLGETHEIIQDWHDSNHDPHRAFTVDYRINGNVPTVHVFVVGSASKITRVTASSLFFKSVKIDVPSVVIVNHDISVGPRQKERLQVAGDRLIWNIDTQAKKLREMVKFN